VAHHHRNQNRPVSRYRPPGIIPLELWDLKIGDRILWDAMNEPEFPSLLFAVLREVHAGRGESRSDGPISSEAAGFDAVYLCGGRAKDEGFRKIAEQAPWPVLRSEGDAFAGERGGLELLSSSGWEGLVVDLGQTQLKISAANRRWTFPRDFERLPMRHTLSAEQHPEQRRELRRFLGASLCQCARETAMPVEALVVSLPARIDDAGVPEGCSYAGMAGDAHLVPNSLAIAGFGGAKYWLLNDAELAALSARFHPGIASYARTLVLTLGFGVGAAVLISDGRD